MNNEIEKCENEVFLYKTACELIINEIDNKYFVANKNKCISIFNQIDAVYDDIKNRKTIKKLVSKIDKINKKTFFSKETVQKLDKYFLVDLSFKLEDKLDDYNMKRDIKISENDIESILKLLDTPVDNHFNKLLTQLLWNYDVAIERLYSLKQDAEKRSKKETEESVSLREMRRNEKQ